MTWFIILGFMLILIISGFHAHSIHIIFKIGSDTKAVPSWSFVIPLSFFNRLFSKTLIFLFLFFYSQYLN
ncbi:hypothetical protein ASE54_26705 [Bacillus sp. Root131]|uniref:hypothetical protein n=1 Tax=Bacillus sp. Root131 TaxID=1736451 RepID=UPI00070F0FE6|nr:hypothetical protein [Bacillus sp. Root131]KRD95577.1 hypothetical protein ASE54_26705 [Bacillus sp. Root131]